jgi:hypothetical protein
VLLLVFVNTTWPKTICALGTVLRACNYHMLTTYKVLLKFNPHFHFKLYFVIHFCLMSLFKNVISLFLVVHHYLGEDSIFYK